MRVYESLDPRLLNSSPTPTPHPPPSPFTPHPSPLTPHPTPLTPHPSPPTPTPHPPPLTPGIDLPIIFSHNNELESASERTDTLEFPSIKSSCNIYWSVTLLNFRSKDFSTANEKYFLLKMSLHFFLRRKTICTRDSLSRHLFLRFDRQISRKC